MSGTFALSGEQRQALQLAKAGHSFFLTGGAGTGKTLALQKIINELPGNLIICGATGLSSVVLSRGLKRNRIAETVHSAFGLMDGRYSAQVLIKLLAGESEYYIQRRSKLIRADCLIIDEISMVSAHTLHILNRLLQFCKDSNVVMGGVQRIFCGDFLQLPPIPDVNSGDAGQSAIMSTEFRRYVPHKVELSMIQRTSHQGLARAISDVSRGNATEETVRFLKSQSEPLKVPDSCKLAIFGTRDNVLFHNAESLGRLDGKLKVYKAVDSGCRKNLNRIMAEEKLMLKLGAPVMLIRNTTHQLVNGLRGHVVEMRDEEVAVHFQELSLSHSFKKETFSRCDSSGQEVCSRLQFPLMLCFAVTVHKSQGLSLDQVEVHADDMFFPGLLAVAISRATSPAGLVIKGVSAKSILQPDQELLTNISNHGQDVNCVPDLSCCQSRDGVINDTDFDACYSDDEEDQDDLPDLGVSRQIAPSPSSSANSPEITNLLTKQLVANPMTKIQAENNDTIQFMINQMNLEETHSYLQDQLNAILLSTVRFNIVPQRANGEIFCQMSSKVYLFMTTTLRLRLDDATPKKYQPIIATMCRDMHSKLLEDLARKLGRSSITEIHKDAICQETPAGLGVLRRIGGRTVHLMRKETRTRLKVLLSDVNNPQYQFLRTITQCLQVMMTTRQHAEEGKYPETLKETNRRNKGGALVYIEDETFELFMALENARNLLHTITNGMLDGGRVLEQSYHALAMDDELRSRLILLLPSAFTEDSAVVDHLWALLLRKFLPVANNTYRKKLCTALQATRKLALRQKVTAEGETSTSKRMKKTAQKEMDVDSECRAKPCRVRRSKTSGSIRWVCCDKCEDWFHLACTPIPAKISEKDLKKLEYECLHCSSSGTSGLAS